MLDPLLLTIQHRPYVIAFLLTFLILSTFHIGIFRTLIWLGWGYGIAFLSEYLSTHYGFPYGLYHYIPSAFEGELVLAGIPVWDSISYAFVGYAAYAFAWFLREPHFMQLRIDPHISPSRPIATSLLGAFLMMLADVIIDPTAARGEQWFLGKIYYYPEGGLYFGVPLSNFVGWFLVALLILVGFQILEKFIFARLKLPAWGAKRFPGQAWLGPLFYFGIVGFMLTIQFQIKAYSLLAVSSGITLFLLFWMWQRR